MLLLHQIQIFVGRLKLFYNSGWALFKEHTFQLCGIFMITLLVLNLNVVTD
jgi:hypothetical protein